MRVRLRDLGETEKIAAQGVRKISLKNGDRRGAVGDDSGPEKVYSEA